jgi:hypothetical protein
MIMHYLLSLSILRIRNKSFLQSDYKIILLLVHHNYVQNLRSERSLTKDLVLKSSVKAYRCCGNTEGVIVGLSKALTYALVGP